MERIILPEPIWLRRKIFVRKSNLMCVCPALRAPYIVKARTTTKSAQTAICTAQSALGISWRFIAAIKIPAHNSATQTAKNGKKEALQRPCQEKEKLLRSAGLRHVCKGAKRQACRPTRLNRVTSRGWTGGSSYHPLKCARK